MRRWAALLAIAYGMEWQVRLLLVRRGVALLGGVRQASQQAI